jgi:hypothetical protein
MVHDPDERTPQQPQDFAHCLIFKPAGLDKAEWFKARQLLLDSATIEIQPS